MEASLLLRPDVSRPRVAGAAETGPEFPSELSLGVSSAPRFSESDSKRSSSKPSKWAVLSQRQTRGGVVFSVAEAG